MRRPLLAAAALCLVPRVARAVEYAPVFNATLLGGQYFYEGANSNVGANASVVAGAIVKANDRWSLVPTYVADYQGTKGVTDAVPAGSLFQQEMDQRASATGIYSVPGTDWKLKPSASYKYEFLKQTRDEAWGHGLFDFEKIGMGFEAENVYREPFSYRFGLDLFRIRFPNYQSLESQAPTDPLGNPLNRAGANTNTLDTYNTQLSAAGSMAYPTHEPILSLQGGYSFLYQSYVDQNVIDSADQIGSAPRADYLQSLSGAVGYPREVRLFNTDCRLDSKLNVSAAYNKSNQNYFDANTVQFFSDAYTYFSYGLGPSASLAWGEAKHPTSVAVSFNYTRFQYQQRQAQDAGGIYTGARLGQDLYQVGLSGVYPIAPGFSLKAQTNLFWARSNDQFAQSYAYNYRTTNFLMGFTYEY